MSRIVFLDIDGVLNPVSLRSLPQLDPYLNQKIAKKSGNTAYLELSSSTLHLVCKCWDKEAVRLLDHFCREENMQIVISSSWGIFYSLAKLKLLFAIHKMDDLLIDTTPYIGRRHENILGYVHAHQEISAWVALDDLDMSHYLKNHCVTTKRVLQKEDIMKAKQLLSIQS